MNKIFYTHNTFTLAQVNDTKTWLIRVTECGTKEGYVVSVYESNPFDQNPIAYHFEEIPKNVITHLCETTVTHSLHIAKAVNNVRLQVIANHVDQVVRPDALLFVVSRPHEKYLSFVVPKWGRLASTKK